MGLFARLAGVVNSFFQIGGPAGPGFTETSTTVISAQNAAQSAYVNLRVLAPSNDNDAATKAYVDEAFKPLIVTAQSNAASALLANSGTEHYIVVSTAGTGAASAYVAGAVLWDDGSSTGNVAILGPTAGASIITTTSLTGGTFTFAANSQYVWTGSTWSNLAPSVAGVVSTIQMTIGTSATYTSVTSIPASAVVLRVELNITSAYTAGATISAGQTGSTALVMATADNVPQTIDLYLADQVTAWGGSSLPVLVTIGSSPSSGAGTVTVLYTSPLS